MNRRVIIILGVIVGVISLAFFFYLQPAADYQPMDGEQDSTLQWLSLAVALLSFLTAVVSLIKEIVSARITASKD